MPAQKTLKVSPKLHKLLHQYKLDHNLKSIDHALEELLNGGKR